MPGSTLWGWAGPLLVTALGAFLRFYRLGQPPAVLFDETYYVPDAYGILTHGVEIDHVHNVNALLARGSTHILGLGLQAGSPYRDNPLGWLVLTRPISFYSSCLPPGNQCGKVASSTDQEVLAIGTPLIWWAGTVALLVCLAWWLTRRDWRAGAVLLGAVAGWLPWLWFFWHDNRTEFYYYAVAFDPFLVIAITLCLGLILGPARAGPNRRVVGAAVAGGYLLAVMANFYYLYPVLAGQTLPYTSWLARMWFSGWI